ncbi:MAG: hypothetical protein GXP08_15900 [Gammaproteobacteria bacterium]|nr:hypothetical protein [Gammaproteobacteria bacterium]
MRKPVKGFLPGQQPQILLNMLVEPLQNLRSIAQIASSTDHQQKPHQLSKYKAEADCIIE